MNFAEHDLSLPQLRCFIAVAEANSLAEGGRRLGMSAASVSKAIARLEDVVGKRLLHRSTHGFSLTAEGEALLPPARAMLAAAADFKLAATGGTDGGTIRISAPVGFCRVVLAPLLAGFRHGHPDVHLDVRASNDIVPLAESGIDLALRSGPLARTPGLVQQRWFRFPWIICAAPSYLQRRGRPDSPEALAMHDLIGFRNLRTGQVQSWPHRASSGAVRMAPPAGITFDDGDSGWQAALAGAGIACTPLWMAAAALRDGRAVELFRDARDEPVDLSIVRPRRHLTPDRVTALMEHLLANAPPLGDLE
jgi:DNA-binding transcriptional LysR family regulator